VYNKTYSILFAFVMHRISNHVRVVFIPRVCFWNTK